MDPRAGHQLKIISALIVLVLSVTVFPPKTVADEPVLVINRVGEDSVLIAVDEIKHIRFGAHSMVVVTRGWSGHYGIETISRVWFKWLTPSSVQDPRDAASIQQVLRLFQNRPNPFSPQTTIEYELRRPGRVKLDIYSVTGRLVRSLVDEERATGRHSVSWDGCDEAGRKVASGVYFYDLVTPGVRESRQMILLP
jgi:hypothetical protein